MNSKPIIHKVVIGIPNEGHTLPESYDNHLLMSMHVGKMEERWKWEKRNPRYEFYWHTIGRILTPFARERLTEAALEIGAEYMIQYDDDMVLPVDTIECLLQDMEQHPEIDILAPLAFMRNPPHYAVMYTTTEGFDTRQNQPYYFNEFVKKYPRNQLVECDAVGFGAVIIRTSILKKMRSPFFMSTVGSGEDIFFCYNAKKVGARIFMDTRIKLGHLANPKVIDEEFVDEFNNKAGTDFNDIPHKYNQEVK